MSLHLGPVEHYAYSGWNHPAARIYSGNQLVFQQVVHPRALPLAAYGGDARGVIESGGTPGGAGGGNYLYNAGAGTGSIVGGGDLAFGGGVIDRLRIAADNRITINKTGGDGFSTLYAADPKLCMILQTGIGSVARLPFSLADQPVGTGFVRWGGAVVSGLASGITTGTRILMIFADNHAIRSRWQWERSAERVGNVPNFDQSITDATDLCFEPERTDDDGNITRDARALLLTHGTSQLHEIDLRTGAASATVVRDLDADGLETTVALIVLPDGELYVTDSFTNRRHKLDRDSYAPDAGSITTLSTGVALPIGDSIITGQYHHGQVYAVLALTGDALYRWGFRSNTLSRVTSVANWGLSYNPQITTITSDGEHLLALGGQQSPRFYYIDEHHGTLTEIPGAGNRFGNVTSHSPTAMVFDAAELSFIVHEDTFLARMNYTMQ